MIPTTRDNNSSNEILIIPASLEQDDSTICISLPVPRTPVLQTRPAKESTTTLQRVEAEDEEKLTHSLNLYALQATNVSKW